MPNNQITSKINQLLQTWPPGTVATTLWLKQVGISLDLVTAYVKGRWVSRIGTGAVVRYNDKVEWPGAVFALQSQLGLSIHPGAKTALGHQGAAHFIPMGDERVVLFARRTERIPAWFETFAGKRKIEIHKTELFGKAPDTGMVNMAFGGFSIRISSRARAMFELLHALRGDVAGSEPLQLMEGLATLPPVEVQVLLEQCSSFRVKRLFMALAETAGHAWLNRLNLSRVHFGAGKREFAKGGYLHPRYQITLPLSWKPEETVS